MTTFPLQLAEWYPKTSGAQELAVNVTPADLAESPDDIYRGRWFPVPGAWAGTTRTFTFHRHGDPATWDIRIEHRATPEAEVTILSTTDLSETDEGTTFNGDTVYQIEVEVPAGEIRFVCDSLAAGDDNFLGVDYDYTPPSITGGSAHRDWQRIRVWQPRGKKPAGGSPVLINFSNSNFQQGDPSGFTFGVGDTGLIDGGSNGLAGLALAKGWVYIDAIITGTDSNTTGQFGDEDNTGIDGDGYWREEDHADYLDEDMPKAQKDARWVIQYLRANAAELGINPNKLVAFGNSGGGLSAYWVCGTETKDPDSADPMLRYSSRPNALIPFRAPTWFPIWYDAATWTPFSPGGTLGDASDADKEALSPLTFLFDTDGKRRYMAKLPILIIQQFDSDSTHVHSIAPASADLFALPAEDDAILAFDNAHAFWQTAAMWRMLVQDLNNWFVSNTVKETLLGHFHGAVSNVLTGPGPTAFDLDDLSADVRELYPDESFISDLTSTVNTHIHTWLEELWPTDPLYPQPGISSLFSAYIS